MGQNAQIIMGQIVHHYSLTTAGPGPVNAQIAQKFNSGKMRGARVRASRIWEWGGIEKTGSSYQSFRLLRTSRISEGS